MYCIVDFHNLTSHYVADAYLLNIQYAMSMYYVLFINNN